MAQFKKVLLSVWSCSIFTLATFQSINVYKEINNFGHYFTYIPADQIMFLPFKSYLGLQRE
jgi:hypothetical protein